MATDLVWFDRCGRRGEIENVDVEQEFGLTVQTRVLILTGVANTAKSSTMSDSIDTVSHQDAAHLVLMEAGKDYWISEVILHPKIRFSLGLEVTSAAVAHSRAGERQLLYQ